MVIASSNVEPARDRAVRLFTYLKELTELRSRTIRTLDSYERVIWLADLPRYPRCYSASWFDEPIDDREDVWVEVGKPALLQDVPNPPALLIPWLVEEQIADSSLDFPPLQDSIEQIDQEVDSAAEREPNVEQAPDTRVLLADRLEIQQLWARYIDEEWIAWAVDDRQRRSMQAVYADLFALYQRQQRLGEQFEVVLALGLLNWKTPHGQAVRRHILTAQTSIGFDPIRGTLTVGPAGEGAKLLLEQDMLEAEERPDAAEQVTIENQLEEIGDDVWQEEQLNALLSSWVHAVSPRGRFDNDPLSSVVLTSDPVIRFAPALILRRRTERSLIRTFQDIIDLLKNGAPVPIGVQRLVDVVDDSSFSEELSGNQGKTGGLVEDIYFPLPANNEQQEIVNRLRTRQGVLVQGPPGTGKSHTIANLVSHLLATGRRVLVTSHTARALRVLHEKLPDEIAPLCVSLLGDDRVALKNLEDSVVGITERFNYWEPRQSAIEIESLERELDAARRGEALALDDLLRIRESDIRVHSLEFGGYSGTSEAIARRVAEEAERFSWIQVRPGESQPPPLTNDQSVRLLQLLRGLTADKIAELGRAFLPSTSLLSLDDFSAIVQKEENLKARASGLQNQHPALATLEQIGQERLDRLTEDFASLQRSIYQLVQVPEPWATDATSQVLSRRDGVWRQLEEVTLRHLAAIDSSSRKSHERQVAGLDGRDPRTVMVDAQDLLAHLASGRRLGFGLLRSEPVKRGQYLLETVTVDGRRCDAPGILQDLVAWLDLVDHLGQLQQHWATYSEQPVGSAVVRIAAFRDLAARLRQILAIGDKVAELRRNYGDIPGLLNVPLRTLAEVVEFAKVLDDAALNLEMSAVRKPILALSAELDQLKSRSGVHDVVAQLQSAIKDRSTRTYENAYGNVRSLEEGGEQLAEQRELMGLLRTRALPIAEMIATSFTDSSWNRRLETFTEAWDWARADLWLRNIQDPEELERHSKNLQRQRDQIQATMGKLAAAKAWHHTFQRMTENERQHLMAWMAAMRRIGRGTGKYAAQHRREAREHMEHCRSAIPAWIMPIYRVAESVRPGKDAFDVVIVDEASQSGPEALFLQFIAKQIVVVGDDKQISPESVGISREAVDALRSRNIPDLPFKDALGVDNSFFDQAVIRFGGRIRLKEHFRCMPEIIQFSNNLVYTSEPLIPLRQYGADRLPPVKVIHVPDGYRKGGERNVVNPPEAQAIVEQIKACCDDPAYDGKSMGVISLQGEAQSREIERLLLDAVGPEEIERRALVCGDSYAFQGDERDIIFLSLVAARSENHRIGPMASPRDERRFNVAASRARDQMWLFHTATLDDLSPTCMRFHLLSYCLNPRVEQQMGRIAIRNRAELQDPFDSLFEQDVFHRIQERGYRVLPQVDVAGYRIDLVVEGMNGRLAVECDGDRWHGAEQHEHDMARQRDLERYGWTFWRVRGSSYYRDPEESLEGLWKTLETLEIHSSSRTALGDGGAPANGWHDVDNLHGTEGGPIALPGPRDKWVSNSAIVEPPLPPGFVLKPYKNWEPRPLPDPLTAAMSTVLDALLDIIADEGPIQCRRVYRIYAAAAGISEGSTALRSALNKTLYRGVQLKLLLDRDEAGSPGQIDKIVRLADSPAVVIRERGDRSLEEIPPSEIAAALVSLARLTGRSFPSDANELFEMQLNDYGFERDGSTDQQERVLNGVLTFSMSLEGSGEQDEQLSLEPIPQD